jgi:hypothetical protein
VPVGVPGTCYGNSLKRAVSGSALASVAVVVLLRLFTELSQPNLFGVTGGAYAGC